MISHSSLLRSFKKIEPRAQIVTIYQYKPNTVPGKLADYQIVINCNYANALKRSKKILSKFQIQKVSCVNMPFSQQDLRLAKEELLQSIDKSLSSNSFERFPYQEVEDIKSLKKDVKTNIIHLYGFFLQERVYQIGDKKKVNSSTKTLAKKYLKRFLPHEKYVQFRLTKENCEKISIQNIEIVL